MLHWMAFHYSEHSNLDFFNCIYYLVTKLRFELCSL